MCERDTQLFYFMCSDYYCQITYFKRYDKSTCVCPPTFPYFLCQLQNDVLE